VCYCNEAIGSIVLSSPCHSRPRVPWHLGMHFFSHNSCLFFRAFRALEMAMKFIMCILT
jgi:hypothetical protein